jgi:hypothetical protein
MASKKAALGGSLTTGRHKGICGVLCKWREAVKDHVAPDSCTAKLVAFLQQEMRDAPRGDTEREREREKERERERREREVSVFH